MNKIDIVVTNCNPNLLKSPDRVVIDTRGLDIEQLERITHSELLRRAVALEKKKRIDTIESKHFQKEQERTSYAAEKAQTKK